MSIEKTLHNEIKKLQAEREGLQIRINKKYSKLKSICSHPKTTKKEEYFEGGYLNESEYRVSVVCNYCAYVLDEEIKYGGFV